MALLRLGVRPSSRSGRSSGAGITIRSGRSAQWRFDAGFGATVLAVVGIAVSTGASLFSSRLRWLPQVANSEHTNRWWLTAAVAALAAGWWARDSAAHSSTIRHDPDDPSRFNDMTRPHR